MSKSAEKTFIIEGMSCAACSAAVERVTRKIDGVVRSDVNLTTNKMHIVFDPEKVPETLIVAKVQKAGFGCKAQTDTDSSGSAFGADKFSSGKAYTSAGLGHGKNAAQKTQAHTLASAWFFALLLMYVSMGHMIGLPLPPLFAPERFPSNFALLNLLCTVPILFIGRAFYFRGFKSAFHLNPNMDTLVALGSTSAFIYSLVLTFLIPLKPQLVHDLYYEAAAFVLVFVMSGKYLEARGKEKTKRAIEALMTLQSDTAFYVDNFGTASETIRETALAQVKPGDIVLVKAGQRIPLDGTVIKGTSGVDESMLTGESLPAEKQTGSAVTGGSMNGSGVLYVRVDKTGKDTALAKIIAFVEEAQSKKAPISQIADKVSAVFVPIVIGVAVIAGIVWAAAGAESSFILRVCTSVLVIACPCALGLATPAAIMTGTGLGASNGILIRSGEALETAKRIDTVVLDKTGTLTEGKPEICDVFYADGKNEADVLCLAAAVENASSHPLAKAVTDAAQTHSATGANFNSIFNVVSFENISGKGVRASVTGGFLSKDKTQNTAQTVLAGNRLFMQENGIECSLFSEQAERASRKGAALIYLALGTQLLALITVTDKLKAHSAEAVFLMKKQGLHTVLLTGDNKAAAEYIGKQIQTDQVIAEVLPQDKAAVIQNLQAQGHTVMMVGDGINDAPALVQADVGAAMGNGSDIAVESGDIVLVKGDLRDAAKAVKLSRMTIRNIKQNLFWAFFYNSIGLPLAAGLLYRAYGVLLSPMIASFAMSLSSVFVVTNALRLRGKKL